VVEGGTGGSVALVGGFSGAGESTDSVILGGNKVASNPKTTYFDAFNHKVREQHTGFDGRKIDSDTYYDNLGRVDRASLPYFTDEQSYFITTQYDAIGRLTSPNAHVRVIH
jgi:hypothetical protein